MFKYETHLHTNVSSNCAKASPKEQVEYYASLGYQGICVTDHFVLGDNRTSYLERVEKLTRGYEQAKIEGERTGLQVLFGFEYTNQQYVGLDILTYGLDINWLLNHPEIDEMDINEYCDFARQNGAILIHAHPFREAGYIPMIRLLPRKVDGVEVLNANRKDFENELAKQYAINYSLSMSAGSDNHTSTQARLCGIESENIFTTTLDMAKAIINGQVTLF